MDFHLGDDVPRYWHSGSAAITHFFHALSLVFPEGEKFFIDSVRYFSGDVSDPKLREEMTYTSPTTGQPVGLSFLIPHDVEDLERRRNMMARWAWASCGMMGRSPDFLNVIFTAWAGEADYFAQDRP